MVFREGEYLLYKKIVAYIEMIAEEESIEASFMNPTVMFFYDGFDKEARLR